jgi:uridine kinase
MLQAGGYLFDTRFYRQVDFPESRVVIIEGIYALSERLRPLLDLRVSVTGGVHFDLVKRVLRDINRSGQEPEDIIHQISETVSCLGSYLKQPFGYGWAISRQAG